MKPLFAVWTSFSEQDWIESWAMRSNRVVLMREIEAPVSTKTSVNTSLTNTSIDEEESVDGFCF